MEADHAKTQAPAEKQAQKGPEKAPERAEAPAELPDVAKNAKIVKSHVEDDGTHIAELESPFHGSPVYGEGKTHAEAVADARESIGHEHVRDQAREGVSRPAQEGSLLQAGRHRGARRPGPVHRRGAAAQGGLRGREGRQDAGRVEVQHAIEGHAPRWLQPDRRIPHGLLFRAPGQAHQGHDARREPQGEPAAARAPQGLHRAQARRSNCRSTRPASSC
jgi:hypothetical protein